VAGAVLLVLAVYLLWPRPDPLEAVTQVRQAFANRDVASFQKVVDEDAMLDDAMNQMEVPIADAIQQASGSQNSPWASLGVSAFFALMKPEILPNLKTYVNEAVAGGAWNSPDSSQQSGNSSATSSQVEYMMVSFLHGVANADINYVSSEVVSRSPSSAQVVVNIRAATQSGEIPVTLDMTMSNGAWRIERIEKLTQVFSKMAGQA